MLNIIIIILLYFVMVAVHFVLEHLLFAGAQERTFVKYYLFLTLLFLMVITVMSVFRNIYPDYLGFVFMGLVLFKIAMMFILLNQLHLSKIPHYKVQFILPYLIALVLETVYSINLINTAGKKHEKNQ